MRLRIEETEVVATYLPFEAPNNGAIMQLLLHYSEQRESLHDRLTEKLRQWGLAMMDNSTPVDCCTEIRLLNYTILETIDLIRMFGWGVQEIHPHH